MKVDEVLSESMEMSGSLGVVAFVVIKALQETGASPSETETTRKLLFKHFAALTDEHCNVLTEVMYHRLKDRPDSGRWY